MKIAFLFLALVLITGCSKTAPEPEFYLSATIDGKNWVANLNNSQNTTVAAIISRNLVVVLGSQNTDNTVTAVGLVFPKSVTVNQTVAINPAQSTALAYSISQTDGYSADPAKGGSGTITIIRLDETANVIEGTFSGETVFNQNSSRVSITNGRFRTPLFTVAVTSPPPGKR